MTNDPMDVDKTMGALGKKSGDYTLGVGDALGQYKILRPLGRGGMGEVYLAEHRILLTKHAVKLLPAERSGSEGFVQRFHDEARVMATLQHPGVVHVTHADESAPSTGSGQGGRHYLVMDFVGADGGDAPYDLEEAMAGAPDGRLAPDVVARLAAGICDAVAYAHERGVIHRDLKPANVLLTSRDVGKANVRVADFGLARLVGEDWLRSRIDTSIRQSMSLGGAPTLLRQGSGGQALAQPREERDSTGAIMGTYEYMSPEQREGREVTARSDIFAVGVMLYRMVTGKRLVGRAKAASKLVAGLSPEWDELIDRCLEENASDRPESMKLVGDVLRGLGKKESQRKDAEEERKAQRGAAERAWQETQRVQEEERQRKAREDAERETQREEDERRWRGEEERRIEKQDAARSQGRVKRVKKGHPILKLMLVLAILGGGYAVLNSKLVGSGGPKEGQNWTSPSTGMEFVWVPALKIWVGKYEVTNGEYRKYKPGHDSKAYEGHSLNGDRQPVVQVSFDDAKEYAAWLTRADGLDEQGIKCRLPSEDEWMGFAQCGRNWEFPWEGGQWPPRSGQAGNYCGQETKGIAGSMIQGYDDGYPVTCNVDDSWENSWGLFGVGGNVWEAAASEESGSSFWGGRGASWLDHGQGALRCSFRGYGGGSSCDYGTGFRLVLSH